jgi:U4/U6 small nuclear ribonucleoprotein PRP31
MSLQIALSTVHDHLPQEEATTLIENTNTAVLLHEHHNLLMMYLESCMQSVAPNLCELVGSLTASKLISGAGGVKELAAMPACNIQVLGGQRSAQIGFSQMERNHTGTFSQMELVKDAPKDYQMQLVRMLACNTAKCARADMLKSSKGLGAKLREDMYERYEKIQEEGGLHRIDKPLPVPDLQPKKRRGGKRYRKTKELF